MPLDPLLRRFDHEHLRLLSMAHEPASTEEGMAEERHRLRRVGDAAAGRNVHAAAYDAMRPMKEP